MPVDKFGNSSSNDDERGSTREEIDELFLRVDGLNQATGVLDMGGHLIRNLPTGSPQNYRGDEVVSWKQTNTSFVQKDSDIDMKNKRI